MTDILSSTICTDGGQGEKVRPLASIFVEEEPGSGTFFPVGCCITRAQLPKLTRDSIVDDTCINIQTDCFGVSSELTCDTPPTTQPGPMQESEFGFMSNYVPGGTLCEFFELSVKCATPYRWLICYANGKRQLIDEGWVKAYEPEDFESGAKSASANVMVSISGEWSWESSGSIVVGSESE